MNTELHTEAEKETARQTESDFQRKCSEFVAREVYCCASTLVSELAQDEKYMDDLMEAMSQPQYIHTFNYTCTGEVEVEGTEEDDELELEECGETWKDEENDSRTKQLDHDSIDDVNEFHEFTRACPKCGTLTDPESVISKETDPIEAYEHWIVSDWFATKLEEQGEMVLRDFLGLTIWGRTCSGQAIAMDYNVREIVKSLG